VRCVGRMMRSVGRTRELIIALKWIFILVLCFQYHFRARLLEGIVVWDNTKRVTRSNAREGEVELLETVESPGNNIGNNTGNNTGNSTVVAEVHSDPILESMVIASAGLIDNHSKVCVLIPVTSRGQGWVRIEDTFLIRFALHNLASTSEPDRFNYSVFIGYDVGDLFFDNQATHKAIVEWVKIRAPFVSLEMLSFRNELKKPGPMMNFLSRQGYDDGCEFLYRINDDTEFLTPWTSRFVDVLRNFTPPLRGVVGPSCPQNVHILTHDFVHRSHLDIFQTHYPPVLTAWWMDDWISFVYGENNTRMLNDVLVTHHTISTRYEPAWGNDKILGSLIEQGRAVIERLDAVKLRK
jgi:hypothetical protein